MTSLDTTGGEPAIPQLPDGWRVHNLLGGGHVYRHALGIEVDPTIGDEPDDMYAATVPDLGAHLSINNLLHLAKVFTEAAALAQGVTA